MLVDIYVSKQSHPFTVYSLKMTGCWQNV